MLTAKDIKIKLIDSKSARNIISLFHYSGKSCNNSQIHFGVFINETLQGCLQYGPSIDKRRLGKNLGIGMNDFLELNRMALSDKCPKNSESRSLSITLKMLKKQYTHLKLIVSFADACQCGDGTIYRASGFKLHSFKKNNSIFINNDGNIDFFHGSKKYTRIGITKNGKSLKDLNLKPIDGYQMKYIYFYDKELEKRFKFIDFKDIPSYVKMYKGKRIDSVESNTSSDQEEMGGESPTSMLQSNDI